MHVFLVATAAHTPKEVAKAPLLTHSVSVLLGDNGLCAEFCKFFGQPFFWHLLDNNLNYCLIALAPTSLLWLSDRASELVIGRSQVRLLIGAQLGFLFQSMPVSLSRIIHHSHSFTRLEIYHHIYFITSTTLLKKENWKTLYNKALLSLSRRIKGSCEPTCECRSE